MWCLRTTHMAKNGNVDATFAYVGFARCPKRVCSTKMIHIFILLLMPIQQDYWFLFLSHTNILITFFFGYDIYFSEWRRLHILLVQFYCAFFASLLHTMGANSVAHLAIYRKSVCIQKKTMFFYCIRVYDKKKTWMTHCFIFHSRISDMWATNDLRCGLD